MSGICVLLQVDFVFSALAASVSRLFIIQDIVTC